MSPTLHRLTRFAPGLPALAGYRRTDLPHDLAAGFAVAAMAIPGSVATAQLVGFSPVVGLYASTLPMIAYALFGTSRQLMVGPSAATAAIVAAAVAPLAGGSEDQALSLAIALTFITGVLLIGASFLRLGAVADFLSKPILVGFMNGVAINVVLSQLGVLFGFRIEASGIVPRTSEFIAAAALDPLADARRRTRHDRVAFAAAASEPAPARHPRRPGRGRIRGAFPRP